MKGWHITNLIYLLKVVAGAYIAVFIGELFFGKLIPPLAIPYIVLALIACVVLLVLPIKYVR